MPYIVVLSILNKTNEVNYVYRHLVPRALGPLGQRVVLEDTTTRRQRADQRTRGLWAPD